MHETGLVRELLRQVLLIAEREQATRVEEVRVACGPLSGVEPVLVREAFLRRTGGSKDPLVGATEDGKTEDAAAGDWGGVPNVLRGVELVIEEPPLVARCIDCGAECEIADFRFVCPRCQGTTLDVLQGDSFHLLSVTLE